MDIFKTAVAVALGLGLVAASKRAYDWAKSKVSR